VLVYFSAAAAERAVARLREAMKPGAWLVLGNMDLGSTPRGMTRVGPAALCVYTKDAPGPAWHPVKAPAAEPQAPAMRPRKAPLPLEELDPVEWHRAVLAEMEAGNPVQGARELRLLVEAFPDYLPGLFEHALALRRCGQMEAAADILRELLRRSDGQELETTLKGPEPISLEFFVTSARSFLESAGGLQ